MSTTCRIDSTIYTVSPNTRCPQTNGDLISAYLESAEGGPFRFNQLCDKICSLVASLDVPNSQAFKEAATLLRGGWSMTIIPGLPGFFARAYDALSSLVATTTTITGAMGRKVLTALQETATCVSAVAYATAPFLKIAEKTDLSRKVMQGAEVSTFVADTCDLLKNGQDAYTARTLVNRADKLSGVSAEFKEAISSTQNFHIMKVMKSVCSVSSFLCGMNFLSGCCAAVPARAAIAATVSLVATLLSVASSLYEKGMKYQRIKFFNPHDVYEVECLKELHPKKSV